MQTRKPNMIDLAEIQTTDSTPERRHLPLSVDLEASNHIPDGNMLMRRRFLQRNSLIDSSVEPQAEDSDRSV